MSALSWLLSCAFGVLLLAASFAATPSRFRRRFALRDPQSLPSSIRSLKALRIQIVIGEVLLVGAFVYLHSSVSSRVLYPATVIAASALVACRRVMGSAVEAMDAELQNHQVHQAEFTDAEA